MTMILSFLFQLVFYPPTCAGPQPGHSASDEDTVLVHKSHQLDPDILDFNFGADGSVFVYDVDADGVVQVDEVFLVKGHETR
jgi:hypothetical protein